MDPLEIRYCKHGGLQNEDAARLRTRLPEQELDAASVVNWRGKSLFMAWFIGDKPFRVYAGFAGFHDTRRAFEWAKAQSRQTGMVIRFEGPDFECLAVDGDMIGYPDGVVSKQERAAWAIRYAAYFLPQELGELGKAEGL